MNKVWELISRFKRFSRQKGWKTSESEDWVESNEEYHNFVSARAVTPASFKAAIKNRKCVVREGTLYTVVESARQAWLFSERPSEEIFRTILDSQDYSNHIAIFDLSPWLEGHDNCFELNNTDSPVFREFEAFLQTELKLAIEPVHIFSEPRININGSVLPQIA
jgi:hypothetical protein